MSGWAYTYAIVLQLGFVLPRCHSLPPRSPHPPVLGSASRSQVVGATGSTTIAFILPGLLYLKVHPEPHPKRSLAALQLSVGLLIIPVALTVIALGESPEGRR